MTNQLAAKDALAQRTMDAGKSVATKDGSFAVPLLIFKSRRRKPIGQQQGLEGGGVGRERIGEIGGRSCFVAGNHENATSVFCKAPAVGIAFGFCQGNPIFRLFADIIFGDAVPQGHGVHDPLTQICRVGVKRRCREDPKFELVTIPSQVAFETIGGKRGCRNPAGGVGDFARGRGASGFQRLREALQGMAGGNGVAGRGGKGQVMNHVVFVPQRFLGEAAPHPKRLRRTQSGKETQKWQKRCEPIQKHVFSMHFFIPVVKTD